MRCERVIMLFKSVLKSANFLVELLLQSKVVILSLRLGHFHQLVIVPLQLFYFCNEEIAANELAAQTVLNLSYLLGCLFRC